MIKKYGNNVYWDDLYWNSSKNYDFVSIRKIDFSKIRDSLNKSKEKCIFKLRKNDASKKLQKIIQMLREDEKNDFDNVIYFNKENRQKEIFINNDYIDEFVQAIVNCKNFLIRDFYHALYLRYNSDHFYNKEIFIKEEPFWEKVVEKLTEYIKDYDSDNPLRTVKIVNLELLVKEIQEFINIFQKLKYEEENKNTIFIR